MQGLQKSLHWADWPLIKTTSKRAHKSSKFIGLQTSAIAENAIKNHCEIDWMNAKIVDREQDYYKRHF